MSLRFITTLGDIFQDYTRDKYVLGKKFSNTLKKDVDPAYVNWCRRKIEELKLEIIDAAEQGKRPPKIHDVEWLYKITYRLPQYKFVSKEFSDWLSLNGLSSTFTGYDEYVLNIRLDSFVDWDSIPDPSTVRLDDVLKKKGDNGEV